MILSLRERVAQKDQAYRAPQQQEQKQKRKQKSSKYDTHATTATTVQKQNTPGSGEKKTSILI